MSDASEQDAIKMCAQCNVNVAMDDCRHCGGGQKVWLCDNCSDVHAGQCVGYKREQDLATIIQWESMGIGNRSMIKAVQREMLRHGWDSVPGLAELMDGPVRRFIVLSKIYDDHADGDDDDGDDGDDDERITQEREIHESEGAMFRGFIAAWMSVANTVHIHDSGPTCRCGVNVCVHDGEEYRPEICGVVVREETMCVLCTLQERGHIIGGAIRDSMSMKHYLAIVRSLFEQRASRVRVWAVLLNPVAQYLSDLGCSQGLATNVIDVRCTLGAACARLKIGKENNPLVQIMEPETRRRLLDAGTNATERL
jgi:hypothetical protein